MVYFELSLFNKLRRFGFNLITKLIFLTCFFYIFSIPFYSAELTMQLYVFDNEFNQPLETITDTTVVYSVVDNDGHEYFSTESDQTISQGLLNIVFDVDLGSLSKLYVFDKNDLNLKIELLDDELFIPFTSSLMAVLSEISDRTIQINDSEIISIDYDNMSINIGPDASSDYEVNIDGVLQATRFIGKGEAIYNALGAGLSDFHSLEVIFSRTCSPVNQEPDCSYGEDVLFVDNHPYVGVYNTNPELPLDVAKTVIFKEGEYDVGVLNINHLTLNKGIMAWDHQFGAFKSGYVSKNETVSIDSFAHASTGIGTNIVTSGLYSLGVGGEDNTVEGDYSAILGGDNNTIVGDYGVLLGSQNESVNLGYVASVGGRGNVVSSNYAVLVSAKQNAMAGAYQTIVGDQNLVNGNDVFVYGSYNQVSSNDVILMGNSNVINNTEIWSINMTDADLLMSNNSNQVIWLADNGLSINTSNISESLNVSGGISALSFSGNGSLLTNVSLVDKYWLMNGYQMFNDSNRLGINTAEVNENIINLKNGILVGESLSNSPGTLSYDGNELFGYTESGAYLLSLQNQDAAYTVSNVLEKNGDEIALSFSGVLNDEFIVYDGISWQYSKKNTWQDSSNELYHERPISFWGSDKYLGRVTVMHSTQNVLAFLSDTNDSGLSFRTGNQTDKSRSIVIGFNYNVQTGEYYDALRSGYKFEFDSLSGGLSLSNGLDDALLEIETDGTINFFNSFTNLALNISTPSQVSYLKIDDESSSSVFKTISIPNYPMIKFEQSGQLTLQSSNNGDINFAILPQSYLLKENENRLRFSALGEMILSDDDAVKLGQVMLTHPDGDLLVDHGKEIGVFESFGNRMLGVALHYNQINFFHSNDDSVVINEFGIGINHVPSSVLAINADQEAADIVLDTSANGGESRFEFSRNSVDDLWGIATNQGAQGSGGLVIENKLDQSVLSFSDGQKININNSETNFRDINIQGDVSQLGTSLQMSNSMSVSDANDIVVFDDDVITFKSIDDFGLGFLVDNRQLLEIANGVISIGGQTRSVNPTKNLYVDTGAYINGSLYYFNEKLENKRIKSSSGVNFDQVKGNNAQTIQFDYDTGFEVTSTGIDEVTLSFNNHFSSLRSTQLDQTSVSDNDGITPQGVDVMGFEGSFISVIADNVLAKGDELGEMDSLSFFNDGMNGADIDGDLVVLGSLNLFNESGEPQSLIGNVSQMENFPFPWQHIITENSTVVDYEYVITENVGIGTSSPIYPLDVNGTTMVDELISNTIRVSNNIVTNATSFPIIAYDNIYMDLNKSQQVTNEVLSLNRLYIMDQKMGLNGTNLNYFMSFFQITLVSTLN